MFPAFPLGIHQTVSQSVPEPGVNVALFIKIAVRLFSYLGDQGSVVDQVKMEETSILNEVSKLADQSLNKARWVSDHLPLVVEARGSAHSGERAGISDLSAGIRKGTRGRWWMLVHLGRVEGYE